MDVRPIGSRDEAVSYSEIGIEESEGRSFQLASHRPAVAILLVLIEKGSDREGIAPARLLLGGLQYPADPGDFEPLLRGRRCEIEQSCELCLDPAGHLIEPRNITHRLVTAVAEEALVPAIPIAHHRPPRAP